MQSDLARRLCNGVIRVFGYQFVESTFPTVCAPPTETSIEDNKVLYKIEENMENEVLTRLGKLQLETLDRPSIV